MKLEVLRGPHEGKVFPLQQGENTAGRSPDNHVHLPSSHVSGRHCAFVLQGAQLVVSDRGSTNGVYVEGHKVREAVLQAGQRVQIGDWLLQVGESVPAAPSHPQPPQSDRSVTRPSPRAGPPPAQPAPPPPAAAPPAAAPPPPAPAQHASAPPPPAASGGFGADPNASGAFGAPPPPAAGPPPPSPLAPPPPPPPPAAPPPPAPLGGAGADPFGSGGGGGFGFGGAGGNEAPPTVTRDIPEAGPAEPQEPALHAQPQPSSFGSSAGGFGSSAGFGSPPAGDSDPGFGDPPSYGGISPAGDCSAVTPMPEDLPGKAKHVWRRVRKLPWSIQLAAIMLFACLCFLLAPGGGVLSQVLHARSVAQLQVLERGKALSLALAARNVTYIAEQNNLKLDANFLLGEPGVKVCMITNDQGIVRAPPEKVRQSIGGKDYFAEANVRGRVTAWRKGSGQWHVLAPIRVAHVDGAPASIAGWAYILFDVDTAVSESTPILGRLIMALVVLFGILMTTGLSIWRLSTAPIIAVREELELAMRGHVGQVAVPSEWKHLRDLTHSINRLLIRWKRGDRGGGGGGLDPAVLTGMVTDLPVPVFMVGADLAVVGVSAAAAAWLSSTPDALVGKPLGELLPDPAFLDTLRAACAQVAGGDPKTSAQATQIGANRVAIRAVNTGSAGVVAVVAVG